MRRLLCGFVVLAALGPGQASACTCMGIDNAGFVHATAKRLPSNAKGALFLPPSGSFRYLGQPGPGTHIVTGEMERLAPSSFRISTGRPGASVPAVLSFPDLAHLDDAGEQMRYYRFVRQGDEQRASALKPGEFAALLKHGKLVDVTSATHKARRLVRVGPAGGFKPGASYTIAYLGKVERWRFPASVEHAIDTTPLDTKEAKYGLVADGPPVAMLLPLLTMQGSCSSSQAALVQNFRYVLPAGHRAYEAALTHVSQSKPLAPATGKTNRYTTLEYVPSLCPIEPFMGTAFAGGRDIVHAQCNTRPQPVTVRGWTGMLEVEDRLHQTDTIRVDLGQAAGGACTGFGLLKSALESGDAARIKQTTCALEQEWVDHRQALPAPLAAFPTGALLDQFGAADRELQKCARQAAVRLFNETPFLVGKHLAAYAALVEGDLVATDPARVATAAQELTSLVMNMRLSAYTPPPVVPSEELLALVLDSMVHALIANRAAETAQLAPLLAPVRKQAQRQVPALLAAVTSDARGAANAMSALEVLVPHDPRLHRLLITNASKPHLRAHAALIYTRVAGKNQPDVAIGLLIAAGRDGSRQAIEMLEGFGKRGRAAVPMLIEKNHAKAGRDVRAASLSTLIAVSDGNPVALRVVGAALNAPAADALDYYTFRGLASIGEEGRALVPAFEERMRKPMPKDLKTTLAQSIATMRLPASQRNDLLARLEKAPLTAEE